MTDAPFAALLLAGGRSQRMGCDKALLDWRGQPLWRAQMAKLRDLNPKRLMIACREDQHLCHDHEIEWQFDPKGDESGPMGAIQRALDAVQIPLLVLAVDMPWMTSHFMREELCDAAMQGRGFFIETDHGPEPMAAVYVPLMLGKMKLSIEEGRLGLQRFVIECAELGLARSRSADAYEARLFSNANTPFEWLHEKGRSE
jgi:molybdenum cofactor guanylyltransferase